MNYFKLLQMLDLKEWKDNREYIFSVLRKIIDDWCALNDEKIYIKILKFDNFGLNFLEVFKKSILFFFKNENKLFHSFY